MVISRGLGRATGSARGLGKPRGVGKSQHHAPRGTGHRGVEVFKAGRFLGQLLPPQRLKWVIK